MAAAWWRGSSQRCLIEGNPTWLCPQKKRNRRPFVYALLLHCGSLLDVVLASVSTFRRVVFVPPTVTAVCKSFATTPSIARRRVFVKFSCTLLFRRFVAAGKRL